jgi:uncharacterized protein with HEPN domain
MLAPSLGRPQLSFGREGFPQVQILENQSASAKPLRETPSPCDRLRLSNVLDAAREAMNFVRGRSRQDLDHDRQLVWALVKAIEIVGEAAYQLSSEARAQVPDLPWDKIIAMRHKLVHAYFDINLDILWKTVLEGLPPLVAGLEGHVPREDVEERNRH